MCCFTRWRISLLLVWLAAALPIQAAAPDLWPLNPEPGEFKSKEAASKKLPPALQPAIQFQKVFSAILSDAPPTEWRAELETLTRSEAADPVAKGVSDVAKTWLARVWMEDLNAVLRTYYQQHVAYPETLAGLGKSWPENLRTDPWGEPWVYSLRAPKGFEKQKSQRYQLGPKQAPQLSRLSVAIKNRKPPVATWKITAQDVAGTRSLQFTSGATSALIQPGGMVENYELLYIGQNWALMAAPDQLFTVTF